MSQKPRMDCESLNFVVTDRNNSFIQSALNNIFTSYKVGFDTLSFQYSACKTNVALMVICEIT